MRVPARNIKGTPTFILPRVARGRKEEGAPRNVLFEADVEIKER